VFAQVKTDEKSKGNEVSTITAIPEVLGMIGLKGAIFRDRKDQPFDPAAQE
jgi:hypothetical protein